MNTNTNRLIANAYLAYRALGKSKAEAWIAVESYVDEFRLDSSIIETPEYIEHIQDLKRKMMSFPFNTSEVDKEGDFPTLEGVVDHTVEDWGWESGKPDELFKKIDDAIALLTQFRAHAQKCLEE